MHLVVAPRTPNRELPTAARAARRPSAADCARKSAMREALSEPGEPTSLVVARFFKAA